MMKLFLNEKLGNITVEIDGVENPKAVIILAHGAGAGMNHPSMIEISKELQNHKFICVRFNFPYIEQGRKSPGSPKTNIATWGFIIDHVRQQFPDLSLFISGKSYGGRMGSHYLAENEIAFIKGIIYFGFPLHAPGREAKDRASHLIKVSEPQLFLQGTKDKLANIDLMKEVVSDLPPIAKLAELEQADHSFNVPKRSGLTKSEIIARLVKEVDNWITTLH